MDIYLTEVGCYPLLTAGQEVELAKQYGQGRDADRRFGEKPVPDSQERRRLAILVQRGDRARQRLIECNLRLVVSLAKRFRSYGVPFGDLVQEGNVGLMEAVERYDPERGVRLATYAGWWILRNMRRAVRQARAIQLPLWMADELHRLRKVRADLESQLARRPTAQELADAMGSSAYRIRRLIQQEREILSLETPLGDGEDSVLADLLPDRETPPVEGIVVRQLLKAHVRNAVLAHLEPRDQEVLCARFGLDGNEGQTLEEVAEVLGITRERVRQLERRALQQLRGADALQEFRAW
jgi:DNA-directed RNA polymerase sigma subunit (sigma70/sigma32)